MAFNVDQKNGIDSGKAGPFLREKKSTFSRIMKLKRRISNSFGRMSISREDIISDADRRNENVDVTVVIGNRYSDEFLDTFSNIQPQPEPNGNFLETDMSSMDQPVRSHGHGWLMNRTRNAKKKSELVKRAWSVTQGAIAEGIFEEEKSSDVQRRQKKPPPRPKSECLLQSQSQKQSATTNSLYRLSTFQRTSPFGRSDAYIKLEQLGEGSYATVYKGVSNLNNKLVALKEIRLLQEEGTPFTAIREASLLRDLKHSNVVTLHDIVHTKETLTFVFEFVHTDLSQYLERHGGGLNPKNVKLFLFQLLRGLAYIHSKRVLHRDLKPQNLLISEIGELKLADFGLARAKSVPSHTYSHEVVTLWYRPPDVLLGSTDYSTSLDIWGVGCIFIEMITGFASFPGVKDAADQLDKIWRVFGTPTEDTWEGVGRYPNYKFEKYGNYTIRSLAESFSKLCAITHAESIASEFLQMNPMHRMPAEAALRHCYFEDLPLQIYEIPDQLPIFTVTACKLAPEINNRPVSVMRAAAKLREKM